MLSAGCWVLGTGNGLEPDPDVTLLGAAFAGFLRVAVLTLLFPVQARMVARYPGFGIIIVPDLWG